MLCEEMFFSAATGGLLFGWVVKTVSFGCVDEFFLCSSQFCAAPSETLKGYLKRAAGHSLVFESNAH